MPFNLLSWWRRHSESESNCLVSTVTALMDRRHVRLQVTGTGPGNFRVKLNVGSESESEFHPVFEQVEQIDELDCPLS